MNEICNHCQTYKVAFNGVQNGIQRYKTKCWSCSKKPYTRHKKDKCERCGFVPEHRVQLDVDHIDGDHKNNAISNLRTLCANCHRLKTHQDRLKNRKAPTIN